MTTYRFFVRNVVSPRFKAISHDLIHYVKEDGTVNETTYIAYPDSQYAKKAEQLNRIQKTQKFVDNEYSNPFFAALKVFIAMGHNSDFTFEVDEELNVTIKM